MFNFKTIFYLIVLYAYSICQAGSYDDFFTAIKRDDANTVISLLNRGFDANTLSPAGEHGLLLALREPSLKVATVLINWPKTQVESRNRQDESPLMLAAIKGLTDICQQLISKGADVNKPGWAPLHYAATHGHLAVMNLLLENHAYIDAASPNGSTPLMLAASYGTPAAVKLLLEAGADPMLKNEQGLSAIDFAQRANRADSAEIIAAFVRSRQPKGKW
ncbi:MAG: ankyrin repeat domain-containing protein [Rhodoferax sp.]|uniref:ankyrin repeat domain-containing protein n=1 Tax=Rhodoferax sp. TaxID=50421 RepID=UPI0013FF133C|nr:ankyrin repeat domain-containing protein [Rhodoferax sp.]NDP40358.1 ankyrin repeat domain-containing protein [Rhodoferax sp.]